MSCVRMLLVYIAILGLTGCAATTTMISKGELETNTKMSSTVFLDPVNADKKRVYLQTRNTSDKQTISIEARIEETIEAKGYRVVNDPEEAHYIIQTNLLSVGEMSPSAAESAFASGYGGGLAGAAIGGAAAESYDGAVAGGVVGAAAETVANAMVEDVTFAMITDLQISERLYQREATEKTRSELKQGTSGNTTSTYSVQSNWKRYQTRIVSTANKANLAFAEAKPELETGVIQSISGIL